MDKQSVRVRIEPDSKEVWVVSGSTISEALFAGAIPISMPCGGHARCGRCLVYAKGHVSKPTPDERARVPAAMRRARLACAARLDGDAVITVPASTRISIQKITARGTARCRYRLDPGIVKIYLGKRGLGSLSGRRKIFGMRLDEVRLAVLRGRPRDVALRRDRAGGRPPRGSMAVAEVEPGITWPTVRAIDLIARALGKADWVGPRPPGRQAHRGAHSARDGSAAGRRRFVWPTAFRNTTLVVTDDHAVEVEQGDTSGDCCGAALDVGTNTLVCSLIDLTTGRELGLTSAINPQVTHGDDVISRIRFSKTPGGLGLMQREIVSSFNGMIDELARRFGIRRDSIYICSAVGNTAMQHIFLGLSPADLGRAPYRARMTAEVDTLASKSGVDVHPDCRLIMPPMIGGFVGGDIVALILSQRLWVRRRPVLAVDLGTNGEVVLASGGRLLACSTAAGPAFEGERISAGVRAIDGAIEDVRMSARGIVCKRIGRASPVGLCGSGLLSAVGEMVRLGIIDPTGRIRTRGEIEQRWARGRVIEGERGREFVIDRRQMISLSQGDVREVQLGKAAIAAGMKVLCRLSGIRLDEVSEILIAGSFGSSLRSSSVRLAGLVPYEFRGRIKAVGNSAIEGAKLMLTSRKARVEARRIAALTEHVELFSRPEFKEEFYNSMGFPPVDLRD